MVAKADDSELLSELRSTAPEARAARLMSADPSGDVLVALADRAARLTTTDADDALAATSVVAALADEVDHAMGRARARRAHARALSYAGRFNEALLICEEASAIARDAGHPVEAARVRLASMHALTELGQLEAALAVGEAARDAFLALDRPALAARADINLGIVHQRRDDPADAVRCFERARAPLAGEAMMLGHLENNRGEALLALNDFAGAEHAFVAALEASVEGHMPVTAAIAEGNLADLAARQGHLQEAVYHFERARRGFEANSSPTHLARLLAEIAEAKAVLGLPGEALNEYEAVLPELERCGLALEAARARRGMGLVLLRLGCQAEAETALAAAAKGFEDLSHGTARAKVDLVRADLLASHGRVREARRLAHAAAAVLADRPADAVAARHLMARLAMSDGDLTLAENELNTAVDLARELDLPPLLSNLLHTRGRVHRRRGRTAQARDDLSAAVEAVERVRGTLQADRFRAAYLGGRCDIYEDLVDAMLASDDPALVARALDIVEKAKSRTLLDQISAMVTVAATAPGDELDPTAAALERRLDESQSRLNALYSRLAEAYAGDAARDDRRDLQAEIRRHERDLDGLRSRLSITSGRAGLLAPTTTSEHVRASVDPGTLLLEYMSVGDELIVFAIGADGITVRRELGSMSQAAARVSRLRFQIDRVLRPGAVTGRRYQAMVEDTLDELAGLHRMLLDPVEDRLAETDRLTIVPHGPLHLVPFHALWDGRAYLIDSHAVHYAPSASILSQLRSSFDDSCPAGAGLVVGVPDEVAPRIGEEAEAVARAIDCPPGRLLLGDSATVDAVTGAARHAAFIHLACHGRFLPDSPLSSGLRLADRWLTVRDIHDLCLDADLVTLSGCETGVNTITAGDELMGLLRGFFAAGARSVLASLWRADDESTARFMCRFHERRLEHAPQPGRKMLTLREVQLEMKQQWAHPAFWAPFILVGRS